MDRITRKDLLTAQLDGKVVDRIEVREVTLAPGQASGLHTHPGGTVGYILAGDIVFQIEGQSARKLRAGDSFFEPPAVRIARFDNASDSEEARFLAFYPLEGDEALFEMLS
jgi:quercetin dioxygenase-like cupin family protein